MQVHQSLQREKFFTKMILSLFRPVYRSLLVSYLDIFHQNEPGRPNLSEILNKGKLNAKAYTIITLQLTHLLQLKLDFWGMSFLMVHRPSVWSQRLFCHNCNSVDEYFALPSKCKSCKNSSAFLESRGLSELSFTLVPLKSDKLLL